MRKRSLTSLLFAAAVVMAGTQLGSVEAQAKPHHGHGWEDRWDDDDDDDRWDDDDDRWDDDDDRWDDDDDGHWDNNGDHCPAAGGAVNVVYFCEEDNTVWAN